MSLVISGFDLTAKITALSGGLGGGLFANTLNRHTPVLADEVLEIFALKGGDNVIDATCGLGGHTKLLAAAIGRDGKMLAIDRDQQAVTETQCQLADQPAQIFFCQASFDRITELADKYLGGKVQAILFDLGINSSQLDSAQRGFSFSASGPLDMRMDCAQKLSAAKLLSGIGPEQLANLLYEFGEERYSRRIARRIIEWREKGQLGDTQQLARAIRSAYPAPARHGKIDPATRSFQALRIAVNNELQLLQETLPRAAELLAPAGKLAVISFHSLEDRVCKRTFQQLKAQGYHLAFRKPLIPTEQERQQNPRSRSAKLRVLARDEGSSDEE